MVREAEVVRSLVEMADTLVDDFDRCVRLLGVSGTGVVLATNLLTGRIVIGQAKSVIAKRACTSLAEAFSRLRAYARNQNRRLTDVARAAIDGTLGPRAWAPLTSRHSARRPDGPACGGR